MFEILLMFWKRRFLSAVCPSILDFRFRFVIVFEVFSFCSVICYFSCFVVWIEKLLDSFYFLRICCKQRIVEKTVNTTWLLHYYLLVSHKTVPGMHYCQRSNVFSNNVINLRRLRWHSSNLKEQSKKKILGVQKPRFLTKIQRYVSDSRYLIWVVTESYPRKCQIIKIRKTLKIVSINRWHIIEMRL